MHRKAGTDGFAAAVAQLVEHRLPKPRVTGSSPACRSFVMLMMTLIIVAVLIAGYLLMSTGHVNHINRAAVAMFCGVIVWVLYVIHGGDYLQLMHPDEYAAYQLSHVTRGLTVGGFVADNVMVQYIAEACSVILFLIASNTILEIMSNNGVFDSLNRWLRMRSSRRFLWILSILTFLISANVDNLTTVVLMMSIMSKIVNSHRQKVIYACAILVAANLGGSFTVIGDMPSLMLWTRGLVTASAFAAGIFPPAFASLCVFNLLLSKLLCGKVEIYSSLSTYRGDDSLLAPWQKSVMLFLGIAGLWSIPTFAAVTHFPPFIGALCVLAVIWVIDGIFNFRRNGNLLFVRRDYIRNTEFIGSQIVLYYLGITLGVGALKECGALDAACNWLTQYVHNVYAYGTITALMSSVIDNVPFVMAGMHMFDLDTVTSSTSIFVQNGAYWQMLSYCSAIGGCLLYVGTLAGHAVVDLERVRMSWYLRHIVWRVLTAWVVGMIVFWLIH